MEERHREGGSGTNSPSTREPGAERCLPHNWVSMVQDINASFLIGKDLVVSDDAFPVAKDNDARPKTVVDLVALQVRVRSGKQFWRKQGA